MDRGIWWALVPWIKRVGQDLVTKPPPPMAESEEELKSLLMQVKEESDKAGLTLNIQKNKIMASSPINSWQIDGQTMERVRDFIFLGSKITVDVTAAMKSKDTCFLEEKLT